MLFKNIFLVNVVMPYWRVLYTDYATYAIIYACIDLYDEYVGSKIFLFKHFNKFFN